jgi:putative hydrolase of the HAD superfamily
MSKYRHLFFDLDNTLYNFDKNAYQAMKLAFEQLNLMGKLSDFDVYFSEYLRINEELWTEYRNKKISKDYLRGERFKRSLALFAITYELEPLQIDDRYLQIMSTQTELFPNVIEILSTLKMRGYQLHIITNGFKEVQTNKLINTGLDKYFTYVYISEEIKSPKPSREIFEYAIKSSNARKKESIMIGDSWESDIIGAKNFGIDQVYYDFLKSPIEIGIYGKATYTITDLNELLTLFK